MSETKTEICLKDVCIRFYNQNAERLQGILILGVCTYFVVSFIKSLDQ